MRVKTKKGLKDKEMKLLAKERLKPKKGRILCIILKEVKGSTWVWIDQSNDRFSVDGNTYFPTEEGTYIKGLTRFLIFLEGVSIPIHHGYIERENVEKTIVDRDTGETKTFKISKIKGLNFDSNVIDIMLNRHLADVFTKVHMDLPNMVIIILLVVTVITGVISVVGSYMWR